MSAIGKLSRSSSIVLGLLYTVLLAFGIYFVGYFMVVANDETLVRESEAAIEADIRGLAQVERVSGIAYVEQLLHLRMQDSKNTFFYAFRSPQEKMMIGNIPRWPNKNVESIKEGVVLFEIRHEDMDYRYKSLRPFSEHYDIMAKVHTFPSGHQLLVGRDVDDIELAQYVGRTHGWTVIGIMLLVAGSSIWVGFYVVTRFNRIADTANNIIQTGNLSQRLPVDSTWDDLSKLSMVLNQVLDALEDLVKGVKSVSDNIAHDLRTPLTRLRGDLDAVQEPVLRQKLLAEADNILSIFNGLLRIADIETEKQKRAFKVNDIDVILQDVVDLYSPLAEEKNIALSVDISPCRLFSDRDLIFQAFGNVLDNAIKFTPAGGHVEIHLHSEQDCIKTTFCDSGVGIDEQYRDKVTTRFFRIEKSRTSAGNGLGLAMVAAVVNLHNGQLILSDNSQHQPGLCCQFVFPNASASPILSQQKVYADELRGSM